MYPVKLGGIEIVVEVMHNTYDTKLLDTGLHKHPFYELSIMTRGSMDYIIKDKTFELDAEKHNIIFIPPKTTHKRVVHCIPSIITGFQIQVNAIDVKYKRFVHNLSNVLRERGYIVPCSSEITNLINQIFSELNMEDPFFKDKTKLLINEFFIAFFRESFSIQMKQLEKLNLTRQSGHNFQEHLVSLACRYVEEHLARQIQIDEIALYCGMSKRHLNRIFSEHKGMALGNYVINRKINEARKKIMRNDSLIKDVAYDLGFSNVSYFCRLFKKITGKTPENYREGR
jgi:two-component system response regulator YesN